MADESSAPPPSAAAAPAPEPSGAPPASLDGAARLQAALAADAATERPTAPAAPAPDRDAPAAPPSPYAGLTREQKQQLLQSDPDLQEEARGFARREIDKREQATRAAQEREQQVQQQYQDLQQRLETLRAARQIIRDPFHEQYPQALEYLQAHTGDEERQLLQAQVLADPEFQQRLSDYHDQVRQAAVVGAIEQTAAHFKDIAPERYAAIRADPRNNTVPLFVTALLVEQGYLSPARVQKERAAAYEEGRRKALGQWETRDFAPDAGGRGGRGGGSDPSLSGEERLRAVLTARARAANGSRTE